MRKLLVSFVATLIVTICFAAVDFSKADKLFKAGDYTGYCTLLESILPTVESASDKAQVLWHLSMACVVMGQDASSKDAKQTLFNKGVDYAQAGIDADPSNPDCYMWHCANVGRACQLKPLMEQASAVPVMTKDLSTILNKLGRTKCSEAWQALAEIYYNHPFKSSDSAINFARRAAMTIPSSELRLSTYAFLAQMLYGRGWSAARRTAEAQSGEAKFNRGKDNIEKYASYDGKLGADFVPAWSTTALGSLTDKEEAMQIVTYAMSLYEKSGRKGGVDAEDYKALTDLKQKWK